MSLVGQHRIGNIRDVGRASRGPLRSLDKRLSWPASSSSGAGAGGAQVAEREGDVGVMRLVPSIAAMVMVGPVSWAVTVTMAAIDGTNLITPPSPSRSAT